MAVPATIRTGLQTNVATTATGFRVYDVLPDNPVVPCAVIFPSDPFIQRSTMHQGIVELHYAVTVLAGRADAEDGQNKLDAMLVTSGTGSVWTAIEVDKTLGGACQDCTVLGVSRYTGNWMIGTVAYFGCVLEVRVLARG